MNQEMFSKFNVYDQIGYLLVGSIGLLVIYLDAVLLNYGFPKFNLTTAVIWLIVAYFLGHIIQAVANVFIKEKKSGFEEREKKILDIAKEFFGVKELSDDEAWDLCYMTALAKDVTGQIGSFNAYYSLYRGWLIIFMFESAFLLMSLIFFFKWIIIVWLVISLVLVVLCYRRSKRFYRYLRTKVLQTFIIIKSLKL